MADEGFDSGTGSESMEVTIEPITDIPVEEPVIMESINDLAPPISEQEISELQNEAAAMEIEPLEEAIIEQPDVSAAERIAQAAMTNADSPGVLAQIAGMGITDAPGSTEAATQLAQMAIDAAPVVAEELMGAAIRQHGKSPAVELNQLEIQQAIEAGAKALE
jgi:hypothetical protein